MSAPRPERVYSHSLLKQLQEHPLARQWPPYLDPAFKNARGVWDPDRWHLERKRGETPEEQKDEGGKENLGDRRKEARKERGGGGLGPQEAEDLQQLVLSPQRRSFLSGCASKDDVEVNLRPEQPGAGGKRVGSGRLLTNRGGQEEDRGDRGGGFRRGEDFKRFPDRREDNKFGSGFRRDLREDEWGDDRRRDGGYLQHDDRRDGRRNEERRPQRRRNEPEWMNETVSHNDVIELRGFDDKPAKKKEVSPPGQLPRSLTQSINKAASEAPPPGLPASGISVEDLERGRHQKPARRDPSNNDQNQNVINNARKNSGGKLQPQQQQQPGNANILNDLGLVPKQLQDDQFNFDDIMATMLGGVPSPAIPDGPPKSAPKSRFSQFFNKGAEEAAAKKDSRRSSIQDELLGANILKEINGDQAHGGPQIKIPSPTEEERYFAPISPAAQTRTATNPLMEMIAKTGGGQSSGKVLTMSELRRQHEQDQQERRHPLSPESLRRHLGLGPQHPPQNLQELFKAAQGQDGHHPLPHPGPQHPPQNLQELFKAVQAQNGQPPPPMMQQRPQQQHQESDNMSAFKKLVAMVGQNNEAHPNQGPPFGPGVLRPSPLPASLPSNAPTEQEILDQMAGGQGGHPRSAKMTPPPGPPGLPPGIASFLAGHPLNLELVSRPEGKQLLMGLESGNITVEHLVQQVSNPALQQRQRDVLLSVLKLVTMQRQGSLPPPPMPPITGFPLPGGPEAPPPTQRVSPLMFPPGAGPGHLSISPVPPQARVPSPQEMTVLTQQIMQNALIKRKLEEQKENFRKRHGGAVEPNIAAMLANATSGGQPPASASPLAFTPTSVMRKKIAERKDSDPQVQAVPELKITAGSREQMSEEQGMTKPSSPGRAITKGKDERPGSLEFSQQPPQPLRRPSPHQMFPPQMQPPSNPLMYLQNNPLGPVSHTVLSQANVMAQQQLAASLMAQGIDPRQLGNRMPPPGHVSPSRVPGPPITGFQLPGQGPLARFFSPEVLAQAQSGHVPAMPPMPQIGTGFQLPAQDIPGPGPHQQKVLTLEEIERIERQSASVRM